MTDALPTLESTLDALQSAFGSDAAAARRIGMTRGAFHLARKRRSISDAAIVAAADALAMPAGYLLACIHADIAAPQAVKTTWHEVAHQLRPPQPASSQPLYYVKSEGPKNEHQPENYEKPDNCPQSKNFNVHRIHPMSDQEEQALLVLQWCLVVARIAPDSPRLAWYCSRWNVPAKIAAAAAAGTLAETLAPCPPIDRRHLPAGIAAIAVWQEYLLPTIVSNAEEPCLHAPQSRSVA